LESRSEIPDDVTILSFFMDHGVPLDEYGQPASKYRHKCFFVGAGMKDSVLNGCAEYVPVSLAQLPKLIEIGRFPIDVALVQVSPPDQNGFVSLGVSVDISLAAMLHAKQTIAEVNLNMPFTLGDSAVHLDNIDKLVVSDSPIGEYDPPVDDVARQIATYIAGIIEDGSTLQIGLGHIPGAALGYLSDRRDLGIHSDLITDSLFDLIENGTVTGRNKTLHRDKVVASFCMGTKRLYDYMHLNPRFEFRPIEYVCDPLIIARNNQMVSVTQAFAVDLTGQICTDQLNGKFYGGVSTQPDFLRGAAMSKGGKPIVCLRSTSLDGEESLIRPQLLSGEGVGISRSDMHYVVTEYGLAYLFGKSIRERALSIIEIAAPQFRPWLLEEGKRLGYLPPSQTLKSQKPYLIEEERLVHLKNGKMVRLRPARASDMDVLLQLFYALPDEDKFTRFFRRLKTLSFNQCQDLCNVSFENEAAFIAVVGERENERAVGSGCYFLDPSTNIAEVGYMIAADWQGIGLGTALQNRMFELAVGEGIRGFSAFILDSNKRMMALARRGGKNIKISKVGEVCKVITLFDERP
jgi:acyl-CoA hydrolase/GNAT superfamily N-acetyltransferase